MQLPLLEREASCTACELHEGVQTVCVPSIHYEDSRPPGSSPIVCVVGQNPGHEEDRDGVPLIGVSGQYTRKVFLGSMIDDRPSIRSLSTIFLMNTVRCWTPQGQDPGIKHYTRCAKRHLYPELEAIGAAYPDNLKIILCLGRFAGQRVWTFLSGEKRRASVAEYTRFNGSTLRGFSFVTTYHPAAFLRERSYFDPIVNHMRIVQDILLGTAPRVTKPNTVKPRRPVAH